MDILNLPDLEVLKVEENELDYLITAETRNKPTFCVKCYNNNIIRHDTNERIISDVCIHSKRTKIQLIHRKYKCKDCGYTFYELLDSIEPKSSLTKRLTKTIERESLVKPFTTIEETYAISNMTVRRVFDKYIKELEINRVAVAPTVLGIDEVHLNKIMRGVLTDIENCRLIEMTENNSKASIKKTIQSLKGWENIKVVTMDMAKGYRYTVNEILPDALIVIDKFHVVQYAQMALNKVRLDVKAKLEKGDKANFHRSKWLLQSNKEDLSEEYLIARDELLNKSETLTTAYWLKEMIRDLYNFDDKRRAYEWFYQIETCIPKGKEFSEFRKLMKTYNGCKNEIFNYFDSRYTNAYTESVNNLIKKVEKSGIGYSFEVLRGKCLYGLQQPKKPKFGQCGFKKVSVVS